MVPPPTNIYLTWKHGTDGQISEGRGVGRQEETNQMYTHVCIAPGHRQEGGEGRGGWPVRGEGGQ